MERKVVVVCSVVGLLGLLSAALGFVAEAIRSMVEEKMDVRRQDGSVVPIFPLAYSFVERRQADAACMRDIYPDRVLVIVEKAERSDIPDIDKKKINVSAKKAIFVFVDNTLPPTAALMSAIYEENKDDDGIRETSNYSNRLLLLMLIAIGHGLIIR